MMTLAVGALEAEQFEHLAAHVARVLLAVVLEHEPGDLMGVAIPGLVRVTTCGVKYKTT